MEGDAIGLQPAAGRLEQQLLGHGRLAAELARQRPFRAGAVGQHAAIDPGTGRALGQLVELAGAVEGEEAHAAREGGGDVALLLDGVAVGDPLRPDAQRQDEIDLAQAGGIEAGAEIGNPRQDLARRIGLHGIEDAGRRQGLGQGHEVMGHQVDIDHEAGRGKLGRLEEAGDPGRHAAALGRQLDIADQREGRFLGAAPAKGAARCGRTVADFSERRERARRPGCGANIVNTLSRPGSQPARSKKDASVVA